MTDYRPGSFFVVEVTGLAGAAIYLGQFLAQEQSVYGHAGVIVAEDGTSVEAAPGGAFVGNASAYKGRALLVCDGPVQQWLEVQRLLAAHCNEPWDPTWPEQFVRANVVAEARKLVGTPYSALDYAALAALHLHLPSRWIRNRVKSSGHMICSQMVDAIYERAGIHLYSDGRYPGDVMPSDLAGWAEDHAMEVTR